MNNRISTSRNGQDARGARAVARADPLLVLGGAAVAVFVAFAAIDGAFPPTVWYAGGIFLLLVLAAAAWAGVCRPATVGRLEALALGALLAFAVWSLLSISWSDVRGAAWDGGNRTLMYVAVLALFALVPWRPTTATVLLFSFSLATAALGLTELARAAFAADPDPWFVAGRFSAPVDYQNGAAALFLMGLWPAVVVASRADLAPVPRAFALGTATALLELALLTQSRAAAVVGAPAALALFLVLVPRRLRTLAFLLLGVVPAVAAAPFLLDVFPAVRAGASDDALSRALAAVAATVTASALLGLAAAAADGRYRVPPRAARAFALVVAVVALAALAAAVSANGSRVAHPLRTLESAWSQFSDVEVTQQPGSGASNFDRGIRGNRYDLWRVALLEFRESPLLGVGADNFAVDYLRERRSIEETLYPHSIPLRALAQTGVVGSLLLATFLIAAGAAVLRRRPEGVAWVTAPAATIFGYWLFHGSADWFWELPSVAAPAFGFLGLALSVARQPGPPLDDRSRRGQRALAFAALLAAAMFVLPWLSAKETAVAGRTWSDDSAGAFDRLERARRLNPLTEEPDLVAGAIASRLGDRARMRAAFERALERNPHSWYAFFELALNAGGEGRRSAALALLARARTLNPREPAIAEAARRLRSGRPLNPAEFDRLFLARARAVHR